MTYYCAEFPHLDKWPRLKRDSWDLAPRIHHLNQEMRTLPFWHFANTQPYEITLTSLWTFQQSLILIFSSSNFPSSHHVLPLMCFYIRVSNIWVICLFKLFPPSMNSCCHSDQPKRGWPMMSGPQGRCWVLRMSLHCPTTLKPEQRRLKCSHDPADETLLCGQTGSQVHRGAAKG